MDIVLFTAVLVVAVGTTVVIVRRLWTWRRGLAGRQPGADRSRERNARFERREIKASVCRNPRCGHIETQRQALYCPNCGGPSVRLRRMATVLVTNGRKSTPIWAWLKRVFLRRRHQGT